VVKTALPEKARGLIAMIRPFLLREFRESYAGTFGGVFWNFFQPAAMVLIYWWVFGVIWQVRVASDGQGTEPGFAVFLLAALLPWLAIQESINKSANAFLLRADVIRHGAFPVFVFPLAKVIVIHAVYGLIFIGFALLTRGPFFWEAPEKLLLLLLLYLTQSLCVLGTALGFASLSVYIRDLPHLTGMLLMGALFTAPVLYPFAQVPESVAFLLWLNPFTPFALAYQHLMLGFPADLARIALHITTLLILTLGSGFWFYKRLRPGFADVL
jgi:lipopolysaccharide transport system permease protein